MRKLFVGLLLCLASAFARGQGTAFQQGNIVNNGDVVVISSLGTVGVSLNGTFVGTINFEGTVDGSSWFAINSTNASTGAQVTTAAAAGIFQIPANGLKAARCRGSGMSSGLANVSMYTLLSASKGLGGSGGGAAGAILANGTVPFTGNQDFGGFNITGVGNATIGGLFVDSTVTLTTPSAGQVNTGAASFANYIVPIWDNPQAVTQAVQSAIWQGTYYGWLPQDATSFMNVGLRNFATGTLSHSTLATTNVYTQTLHGIYTNATSAINILAGTRPQATTSSPFWRGNAANLGGFFAKLRWGIDIWTAGDTVFVGMSSIDNMTATTVGDPGAHAGDFIGIGMDAADAGMTLYTRNSSIANQTSATSFTIGTGSKVFTVSGTGTLFLNGTNVRVWSTANSQNFMEGSVTASAASTVTVNVTRTNGSGTFTDWNLTVLATKTTIPSIPAPASSGAVWLDLYLFAAPNDSTIYYRVDDLRAGTTLVNTTISTTIPLNTAFMFPVVDMGTGTNAGAAACAVSIGKIWAQTVTAGQ